MSSATPKWIDSDAHILETTDVWTYLPKEYQARVRITPMTDDPVLAKGIGSDVSIDTYAIPYQIGGRKERFEKLLAGYEKKYSRGSGFVPSQYLKDLDVEGLDQVVIYPTLFLWATWIPQIGAKFSHALAQAYNDWIWDFCAIDRRRLKPVMVVALHDVALAMAEVRRCAERGFVGVFLRPNPLYGRPLGHPDYHPLYELMQELGLPAGIHEGQLAYLPTLGADRANVQWGVHCMSHPFEQMAAMVSLLEFNVYDKFPRLNFLFLEAGTALWAPYWVNRLEAESRLYRYPGGAQLSMKEYFERQCFVTCEVDDPFLPQLLGCMDDTKLLMSTDYPHLESPYPNSVKHFLEQKISDASRDRIGRTNASMAYPRL